MLKIDKQQMEELVLQHRNAIRLAIARGLAITIQEVTEKEIDKMIQQANPKLTSCTTQLLPSGAIILKKRAKS